MKAKLFYVVLALAIALAIVALPLARPAQADVTDVKVIVEDREATATTNYTITFNITANLTGGTDNISIFFPGGTNASAANVTEPLGSSVPAELNLTFTPSSNVNTTDNPISLTVVDVVNPAVNYSPGYRLQVNTSQEPVLVNSSYYKIYPHTSYVLAAVNVTLDDYHAGATANYTINITTGAEGNLSVNASIISEFPAGTNVSGIINVTVKNIDVGGNFTVNVSLGQVNVTVPDGATFNGSESGDVVLFGIVNPTTAGAYNASAKTNEEPEWQVSNTYTIDPAAATSLNVSGIPDQAVASTAYNVTVKALDPYDNVDPNYTGNITFTSTDARADLPGNYSFNATEDNGVHTFVGNVTFRTLGVQNVTARDIDDPSINGTQTGITVAGYIQTLIDAALPGDTIIVPSGTYYEQVFIDKKLTIVSANGSANTTINGSELTDLYWNTSWGGGNITTVYPVVWIDRDQVVFGNATGGFNVTGATAINISDGDGTPSEMGVGLLNLARNCTIQGNIFDGNIVGIFGWRAHGASYNDILDNDFSDNGMAVYLTEGGGDSVKNSTFIDNVCAIILEGPSGGEPHDIEVLNNTLQGNWQGIQLSYSHNNTIASNNISDTTGGNWTIGNTSIEIDAVAIELMWSTNNTIQSNTIFKANETYAANYSIRLNGSWTNRVLNNDISDCRYDGILLQPLEYPPHPTTPSYANLVQGNTVYNCTSGITVNQSHYNDVLGNTVYNCSSSGIYLHTPGSGNEVGGTEAGEGNIVYNCSDGILLEDSRDEAVVNNTVYNCSAAGIHLNNSHGITIEDNTLWKLGEGNNSVGVYLENSGGNETMASNTIRGNDISYSTENGLVLDVDSGNNSIGNNTIYYNGHGIWIDGDNNNIYNNDIMYNNASEDSGVHLTVNASGNQIQCNNIVNNSYGMYKEGGAGVDAVDARYNWWGHTSGPSGIGVTGGGDAVEGNISFWPWATTEFDLPDVTAPDIVATVAVPDTISLLDTNFLRWVMVDAPYSIGPSYTDLIVDTGCGACNATSATVNLSALVLDMLPADIDEVVADWDQWKQNEWQNWLNQLANTSMDYREWEQHCYWDYELHLDDLLTGGRWGEWNLRYFFEDQLDDMVFEEFRLGEVEIPVTAVDCAGNEAEGNITLAIVDFQLPMEKGWNLRSTPISLNNSNLYNIVHLGDDLNYRSILRWNGEEGRWEQYAEPPSVDSPGWYYGSTKVANAVMQPLEAYYIYASDNDQLGLVINRGNPEMLSRDLYVGWNLIGLVPNIVSYGFSGMPINLSLATIYEAEGGLTGWSIAIGIGEDRSYDEEFYYGNIPLEKDSYEKRFDQDSLFAVQELDSQEMTPGGGYWVAMENDDILLGSGPAAITLRDTDPPELVGFSFTPASINRTECPCNVTFTLNITDDLSGFDYACWHLESPTGNEWQDGCVYEEDLWGGVYTHNVSFSSDSECGNWSVTDVDIWDIVANHRHLSTEDLIALNFSTTLEVVGLCNLTINCTAGGNVTTPFAVAPGGTNSSTYNCSDVVNLVATANATCNFSQWTGDIGTIGNFSAASTNITMNDDYNITANFTCP